MKAQLLPEREEFPTGKIIRRIFNPDGSLNEEVHGYGAAAIVISFKFWNGVKVEETYLSKGRLVSRRSYEKARVNYPDMPGPDATVEDWGADLLKEVQIQQKQRKLERERRLAESEESRFPRPASTNWLRVMAKDTAHLVVFASRDWKILTRETSIPSGRAWLEAFGFRGTRQSRPAGGSVIAQGLQVGYEVLGNRAEMLETSQMLLNEITNYANNPPEVSYFYGSIRPRRKPRPVPTIAWPTVLPPLIAFLSGLSEEKVKIFNHHQ